MVPRAGQQIGVGAKPFVNVMPLSRIRDAVYGMAAQYGEVVWSRSSARMNTKFGRSAGAVALTGATAGEEPAGPGAEGATDDMMPVARAAMPSRAAAPEHVRVLRR